MKRAAPRLVISPHRLGAAFYRRCFLALVCSDVILFVWHATLFVKSAAAEEHDVLVGLAIATAHFLANTIAIADIYVHLVNYTGNCVDFEPGKSTNCFLYSVIGAYADLATIGLAIASKDEAVVLDLYYAMLAQSLLCAVTSVSLYIWSENTEQACQAFNRMGQPLAPMQGTLVWTENTQAVSKNQRVP